MNGLPITNKEIKLANECAKDSHKANLPRPRHQQGASTMTTHVINVVSSNTTPFCRSPLWSSLWQSVQLLPMLRLLGHVAITIAQHLWWRNVLVVHHCQIWILPVYFYTLSWAKRPTLKTINISGYTVLPNAAWCNCISSWGNGVKRKMWNTNGGTIIGNNNAL